MLFSHAFDGGILRVGGEGLRYGRIGGRYVRYGWVDGMGLGMGEGMGGWVGGRILRG